MLEQTLPLTIRLEGFQAEKDQVLKLLEAKYEKLNHAYSQDIETLKESQVKYMQKDAEELNLLLGFVTQIESIIEAFALENQACKEAALWWKNAYQTHKLSNKYKSIIRQVKQL